jgi:hypothetical protein
MAAADIRRAENEALAKVACDLLATHQMEDVMQLMSEKFSVEISYQRLIELIGQEQYVDALCSEVEIMMRNSVSLEQAAQLWNSMGRPSLGEERWTEGSIISIMQ